jgi:hypothetical protein
MGFLAIIRIGMNLLSQMSIGWQGFYNAEASHKEPTVFGLRFQQTNHIGENNDS